MSINDNIKYLRILKGWYLARLNSSKNVTEYDTRDAYTDALDWAITELSPQVTEPIFFLGERVDRIRNS